MYDSFPDLTAVAFPALKNARANPNSEQAMEALWRQKSQKLNKHTFSTFQYFETGGQPWGQVKFRGIPP